MARPSPAGTATPSEQTVEFLLRYTNTQDSFAARFGEYKGENPLRNVVATILLHEKYIGEKGPAALANALIKAPRSFSQLGYRTQKIRLMLLDYLFGSEETAAIVEKNGEAVRGNGRIAQQLHVIKPSWGTRRRVTQFTRDLIEKLAAEPDRDVYKDLPALLEQFNLTREPGPVPNHRTELVEVSEAEIDAKISQVMNLPALPPSPGSIGAVPEADLRRLLSDHSVSLRQHALNGLCARPLLEKESIRALLQAAGSDWVSDVERSSIVLALQSLLPPLVASGLRGNDDEHALKLAVCIFHVLHPEPAAP